MGTVPSTWEKALIIPITKPGKDASSPGIKNSSPHQPHLQAKGENGELMVDMAEGNPYEHGFRRFISTTDALVRMKTATRKSFTQ